MEGGVRGKASGLWLKQRACLPFLKQEPQTFVTVASSKDITTGGAASHLVLAPGDRH